MHRRTLAVLILLSSALSPAFSQDSKTKPPASKAQPRVRPELAPGYNVRVIEGFTVLLSEETVRNEKASAHERKPLDVLELELKTIANLFPPKPLALLRTVLIWVEWDEREELKNGRDGNALAVYYGGHQRSLLTQGKHPLKAKNVTVLRMKSLTEEHQPKRDSGRCVLLHEIAHAVHDQLLGRENWAVKSAYKQAMERKLYDPKMYVSTNEQEFFAELTCAYFNQLHHYPKTRADLKKHDAVSFKLMEGVWGKRSEEAAGNMDATTSELSLRLEEVDLGKPISGPKLTREDLTGRPVVLMLWNAGSTSSFPAFTKLQPWTSELADFGLAALAVHLTGTKEQDVAAAARSRAGTIPVSDARWISGKLISDFKEFPICLVFNHEGQCVYRGTPFDAEHTLREAVGEALVASTGKEEFPKALEPVVKSLRDGKAPTTLFAKLTPLTKASDGETADAAKLLLDKLTSAGRKELAEVEPLVKTEPLEAFLRLERLPGAFKDTPVAARANELLAKVKQDRAVSNEIRARVVLAPIKKLDTELSSRPGGFDPTSEKFRRDNAALLLQLQNAVALMKKNWTKTRAAEEAGRLAEKYGLNMP